MKEIVLVPFSAKAIPNNYLSSLLTGCTSFVSADNQMIVDKCCSAPSARNGFTMIALQFQTKQSRMNTYPGTAHPVTIAQNLIITAYYYKSS